MYPKVIKTYIYRGRNVTQEFIAGKNHEVTDTNVLYCEKTNLILQKKVLPNHLHDKAKLI